MFVVVAALAEAPSHLRALAAGYGQKDATTLLLGCALAVALGALAMWAGWSAWSSGARAWYALPAMVLVGGAVFSGVATGAIRFALFAVPMTASPYGIWTLGPAAVIGGVLTALVAVVDALVARWS